MRATQQFFLTCGLILLGLMASSFAYAESFKTMAPFLVQQPAISYTPDSANERMVAFVRQLVDNQQYSSYKLGGDRFDVANGTYILDCSQYVDHILANTFPNAYMSLTSACGSPAPTSAHYYDFFNKLSSVSINFWHKVEAVTKLQAGDILVFRNKKVKSHLAAGHIMVVMSAPVRKNNTYIIKVSDAAPIGHSQDTRYAHESGIGIGALLLKVNPKTGWPSAYAWQEGGRWRTNVNFAMARPLDFVYR